MALTEVEEKQLKDGLAAAQEALAKLTPLATEVTELKSQVAAKDAAIAELQKDTSSFKSADALKALQTAYPDVPEATLLGSLPLPEATRKALLDPMQMKATELKAALAKTDPILGWEHAGSIMPATEAEKAAQSAERQKAYVEHQKTGNVFGMLDQRSSEIGAFLRRSFQR